MAGPLPPRWTKEQQYLGQIFFNQKLYLIPINWGEMPVQSTGSITKIGNYRP